MSQTTFDSLWKAIFQSAKDKPVEFSAYFSTHEIKKLSLTKIGIQEIQQKVAEFTAKYESPYHQNSKTWMENEYRIFLWAVLNYSQMVGRVPEQFEFEDWNLISTLFHKSPIECNYFYLCSKKGRNISWNQNQDKFILQVMKLPEYKGRWTDIGLLLFFQSNTSSFRKPKALRERWLNHLNPEIVKHQWSLEEDLSILTMVIEKGKRWSNISKILKNRSEHAIKNRFNGLIGSRNSNQSYESKAMKEEKRILSYIQKIREILGKNKEENEIEGQKKIESESQNGTSFFNFGLNSIGFCIFQPTVIVNPQYNL